MRRKKRGQWAMTLPRFDIECEHCHKIVHVPNMKYVGSIKFPRVPKEAKQRYKNQGGTPIDREGDVIPDAHEAEPDPQK